MMHEISRRSLFQIAGIGALGLGAASSLPIAARAAISQRAFYHMTPPAGWLCDPQRPVFLNGAYHLYYLHSDVNNGPGDWDHATTTDGVSFTHHGVAIGQKPNFPVWTGSSVIDEKNTAGFGAGALVALATRPTDGVRKYQEQYLYWSTDGGYTFNGLSEPVIVNTDGRSATTQAEIENAEWFRDPKIHWDSARNEWVCVIGRARYAVFYTSKNLREWQLKRNFDFPNHELGGIECPDLFEMTADDGTRHWVLGASMDAYSIGLPMTYAYWTGEWDGEQFIADDIEPQWLDWGWDWYGAVSWPSEQDPDTKRLAIGWMNNWKYANREVPTDASDGYNGQNSIVRELEISKQGDGRYALLSNPIKALSSHATATHSFDDQNVDGSFLLPWNGRAYELELDIAWDSATNVGVSVGRAADGTRHTNIGKYGSELYVDRSPSNQTGFELSPYTRAAAPIDAGARSVHLRIFVDTQSVEVFVNAGHSVISQQVHFADGDSGVSFYTDGGVARFSGIMVREFGERI
ncbi:glycoside hydrolase family 32 protein [Glutamicibacter sp. JC586]|uniref:glycoside hydrolase family 32 protein n=1 Tax=Glutamicibacter sp. JC586 TaxID=2590552 RepID=UPI001357F07F|nr:glycoside hydrolase family 32 protein [Glutamicibacter sp. JC586]